jgi:iron complex outermembrane receptor protein
LIELHGSRDTEPEVALSYEVGLRSELSTDFALDLAGFYTDYKNLATLNRATPEFFMSNGGPAIRQPLIVNNDGDAGIWGIETVVEGKLSASSRIQLWHVLQIIDVSTRNSVGDPNFLGQSNNNPVNQIALRSQFDIGNSMELNSMVRFVESVPSVNASSYWQADLQLAWRVAKDLRLTLNGSNLLSNDHEESSSELLIRPLTRVERSYFVGLGYSF